MKQSATVAVDQLLDKYKRIMEQNVKPNLSRYARQQFQTECDAHTANAKIKVSAIDPSGRDAREMCLNLAAKLQKAVNQFEEKLQCALSKMLVDFQICIAAEAEMTLDPSVHVEIKYNSGRSYDKKKEKQEMVSNLHRLIQCSYRYIEKNEDVVTLENERIQLERGIDCLPANVGTIGAEATRILKAHVEKLYLVSELAISRFIQF